MNLKILEELNPEVIFVHNVQFQDLRSIVKYKKKHKDVKIYVDNHSDFSNSARSWFSQNTLYRFWWKPCAKKMEPWAETFFGVLPARIDFLENIYGISSKKTDLSEKSVRSAAVRSGLLTRTVRFAVTHRVNHTSSLETQSSKSTACRRCARHTSPSSSRTGTPESTATRLPPAGETIFT